MLSNSGIDTNVFSAYSTRSASVSAANSKGVRLDKILSAGGWSHALILTGVTMGQAYLTLTEPNSVHAR